MKNNPSIGRMISCLYRHTQMYFDRQLKTLSIGYGSMAFLMVLYRLDGIRQEEISQKLHIDKATTTRAIQKLVKAGYVVREPDSTDRRANRIFLTEKGVALKPKLRKMSDDWTRRLTAGFTEAEKNQIFVLLGKLAGNATVFKAENNYPK